MRFPKAGLTALLALLTCPTPGLAQDTGTEPVLFVEVRALRPDGGAARNAAISRVTKPGEVATTYLRAGTAADPEGTLCTMRAAAGTPDLSERDKNGFQGAAYVWKVTTTTAGYESGRLTVDVDWQRFDRGRDSPALSGKQRVILDEQKPYPLDFVRGTTPMCPAAVLELSASVREDPAFVDTVFRYDMWLVRHDKTGRKETRQLILSGVHGADADFQFAPLTSAVPRLQADQYDFTLATRVRGAVRGRVTHDGRVAIELQTHRSDQLARPGRPHTPSRSAGGRKTLTAVLGEAIEIQLPPATGYMSTYVSARAEAERAQQTASSKGSGTAASTDSKLPSDPIGLRDGRIYVNYGPFLEGERLSLIVQVRKAEGADAEPVAQRE